MGEAIRVVVTGVTGKMGGTLVRMVRDDPGMSVVGGTERSGDTAVGLDVGLAARLGPLEVSVVDDLGKAIASGKPHVVIDFTSAEGSTVHARICAERGVALVVG